MRELAESRAVPLLKRPGAAISRSALREERASKEGGEDGWSPADPSSALMARCLVVPLLAQRISRWEDVVVSGACFSDQTGPLELGPRNKSNDFTHVLLQNRVV